jgi:hypothetical protein
MPPEQNLQATTGNGRDTYGQEEPAPRRYAEEVMAPTRPIEDNNIRQIGIRQLSHGYVVEIDCQTFAIESASTLIAKLSEYILNPNATEQKHKEGKLF